MTDLRAHGEYCARQATANRIAANQLEHRVDTRLTDPSVIEDELAHIARLRREADLWEQMATEISDHFAPAAQEEPQLWP